ncbi:CDP-glycerol glycerophosphotransferase family protein [Lachnoclostridium sp. An181]|uniref:CDP-glycerol glycerophosphotransferase family protein n=1 Tax=Lachnoclostridium sp. An181 TaxID=1965575 RepID=UPI000B39C43F|nr:CDP-glycerol glycerophosphotransferase family protein [Lachnoclostridium sp. An181]OUP49745.1 hypothetical protein B5F18_06950 [Lachnoclostridium sp. An181]
MKYIKYWAIYLMRTVLKIFYIVPVNRKRIYFSANRGTSISCNPKYIYEYMVENFPGQFEYVWEYVMDRKTDKQTKYVKPYSLQSILYLLTSKVIISNDGLGSYIPKRKNQCFINTWHGGGAYKRVGEETIEGCGVEMKINKICGKQTDIFISSCRMFSKVMSYSKAVDQNKFLECGMPRNDFLVNGKGKEKKEKVYQYLKLDSSKKTVMFAPTYRGNEGDAKFDNEIDKDRCLNALQKRFGGEWVFLIRKHHFVEKDIESEGCIDVSDYPDMQELLGAVDVFITDYSSTIWDYSLTFKPGFLFVPDLEKYQAERNFYTNPSTWAFPLAKSNVELERLILNFDQEKNRKKIETHHKILENKETGCATEMAVNKIVNFLMK